MSSGEKGGFIDDPELPYVQYTLEDNQTILFAPAVEDNPIMGRIFAEVGIQRFVSLEPDGTVGSHSLLKQLWDNPYGIALVTIGSLEGQGELPDGSHRQALQAIIDNEFETSPWAAYLPRRDTT
jgi:hypothetical protein